MKINEENIKILEDPKENLKKNLVCLSPKSAMILCR